MDEFRAKIIKAIQEWNPGTVTNTNENLSTTFNPVLAEWLKPNFNYSAAYRWDQPLNSSIDGANISTQLRFSSNLSLESGFSYESLFLSKNVKQQTQESSPNRRNRRNIEKKPEETVVEREETSSQTKENEEPELETRRRTIQRITI